LLSAYSGEVDQGSGVMPISVPVDSDQVIGAERRWQSDCVGSDRNRQEEVGRERVSEQRDADEMLVEKPFVSSVATDFSTAVPACRSPFRPSPIIDRLRTGTVIAFTPEY